MTDDVTHAIISLNASRDDHGRLRWHRAEIRNGTFHALCSADYRMDVPAVVRLADIKSSDIPHEMFGHFVDADTLTQCRDCAAAADAQPQIRRSDDE